MDDILSLSTHSKMEDFSTEGVTKGVEDDISDVDFVQDPSSNENEAYNDCTWYDKRCASNLNILNENEFKNEQGLSDIVLKPKESLYEEQAKKVLTNNVVTISHVFDRDIADTKSVDLNTELCHGESFCDNYNKEIKVKNVQIVTKRNPLLKKNIFAEVSEETRPPVHTLDIEELTETTFYDTITTEITEHSKERTAEANLKKTNETHSHKKGTIIQMLNNILNRKPKSWKDKSATNGTVISNVNSQNVNENTFESNYNSLPFLSMSSTKDTSQDNKTLKNEVSPLIENELILGLEQTRKQLKSVSEEIIAQLDKLEEALKISISDCRNTNALAISESLSNQIKGMKTAILHLHCIMCEATKQNCSFVNALKLMTTQLYKIEEDIQKISYTSQDAVPALLYVQKILDNWREDSVTK